MKKYLIAASLLLIEITALAQNNNLQSGRIFKHQNEYYRRQQQEEAVRDYEEGIIKPGYNIKDEIVFVESPHWDNIMHDMMVIREKRKAYRNFPTNLDTHPNMFSAFVLKIPARDLQNRNGDTIKTIREKNSIFGHYEAGSGLPSSNDFSWTRPEKIMCGKIANTYMNLIFVYSPNSEMVLSEQKALFKLRLPLGWGLNAQPGKGGPCI